MNKPLKKNSTTSKKIRIGALFVGLAAFFGNLNAIIDGFDRVYQKASKISTNEYSGHPFPEGISDSLVKSWSTGRLKLAQFQIKGFIGDLKPDEKWLEVVLTNPIAFPIRHNSQFNKGETLEYRKEDRQMLNQLKQRIDTLELAHNDGLFSIDVPYTRLVKRSKSALFIDFKSELELLSTYEKYLLRNEIYARHGRPFKTAKLHKAFSRCSWYQPVQSEGFFNYNELSPVEIFNIFYLEKFHKQKDLGAEGRGVLFDNDIPGIPFQVFQNNLSKEKIELLYDSSTDYQTMFNHFIDLIVEIKPSQRTHIEVNTVYNSIEANPDYRKLSIGAESIVDNFISSMKRNGIDLGPISRQETNYSRIAIYLGPETIRLLKTDKSKEVLFSRSLSSSIAEYLENYGKFIPTFKPFRQVNYPIRFDSTRLELTKQYLKNRYHIESTDGRIVPQMVVVHWTAVDDLQKSYGLLEKSRLRSSRKEISGASQLNVSAHYLVDQNGTVYKLMSDSLMARHVIGLNYLAIGIENVGGESKNLSSEQLVSNASLIRELKKEFPQIKYLIGHQEYSKFRESTLWKEVDDSYFTTKIDPSLSFMNRLRTILAEYNFHSTPQE